MASAENASCQTWEDEYDDVMEGSAFARRTATLPRSAEPEPRRWDGGLPFRPSRQRGERSCLTSFLRLAM